MSNTTPVSPTAETASTAQNIQSSTSLHTGYGDHDPGYPLPSVERDRASTSEGSDSALAATIYTPSVSPDAATISQRSNHENLGEYMQSLRVDSQTPRIFGFCPPDSTFLGVYSGTRRTPAGRVIARPRAPSSRRSLINRRTEGLVDGMSALEIGPTRQPARSLEPNELPRSNSAAGRQRTSRSVTPSQRRQSTSLISQPPYRVEDEELPQAYGRQVPEVLTNARNVTARLAEVLLTSNLHREHESDLRNLYQQATTLSAFQPPSFRIVGFVGESGVGKSSLINSLLDKKEFTRASNSGTACTCVVTEYHFHDRDDYSIHVDYFTVREIRSQLEQLLSALREYAPSDESTMIIEDREDRENREDLKKKAGLAESTFRASFGNKLDDNPEMLLRLRFEDAIDTMMGWIRQVLPNSSTQENSTLRESFNDINQCSDRLRVLTSHTEERNQTRLWPFIRKVRVYLRAHILSRGLTLADLPGLRDLNYARQNVTERYVRQCHQIFAVARIGRATSEAGVREVFDLARQASLSDVGVICTQSDDIRPNEEKANWGDREEETITRMQQDIANQKEHVAFLKDKISTRINNPGEGRPEEGQELRDLCKERDRAMMLLDELESKLSHRSITLRNEDISTKLQGAYGSLSGRGNLKTFCVSNTMYWEERNKPAEKALPFLKLSGIPDLRRYCIGIITESHLEATNKYIKEEIQAFLGSVEVWIGAGSGDANAERKQRILDTVSTIQRELGQLTSPVSRINDISREVVAKFNNQIWLYMKQRAQHWSDSAGQASRLWQSFHPSSYKAFCRNYGTHGTGAILYRCWNEEAISSMKNDMSGPWDAFKGDVQSYLDQTRQSVDEVFRKIVRVTLDTSTTNHKLKAVLNPLTATLLHRKIMLLYDIDKLIEGFGADMFNIRTDALSPVRTAIVGQIMEETYNETSLDYGTLSDRRRKDKITSRFSSPTLFNLHRQRVQEQFLTISNKLQQKIKDVVAQQLAFIEADLNTLRNENVLLETETNFEFRIRLAAEVTRAKQEMVAVSLAIDQIHSS